MILDQVRGKPISVADIQTWSQDLWSLYTEIGHKMYVFLNQSRNTIPSQERKKKSSFYYSGEVV